MSEESILELSKPNDIREALASLDSIVENEKGKPYAIEFYIEENGLKTPSSGRFFLGGTIMTPIELEKRMPDKTILITNVKRSKAEFIIDTHKGWITFYEPGIDYTLPDPYEND